MLEVQLLNDEKQCAEHIMLVDLGRNDVGKVSNSTKSFPNNLDSFATFKALLLNLFVLAALLNLLLVIAFLFCHLPFLCH